MTRLSEFIELTDFYTTSRCLLKTDRIIAIFDNPDDGSTFIYLEKSDGVFEREVAESVKDIKLILLGYA